MQAREQFRPAGSQVVAVRVSRGAEVVVLVPLKSGRRGQLDGRHRGDQGRFRVTLEESVCAVRVTGTGTATPAAIDGRFQGHDCKGQPVQGGFTLTP